MNRVSTIRVFAYGSNMLTRRLRERTASAVPIVVGRLEGARGVPDPDPVRRAKHLALLRAP